MFQPNEPTIKTLRKDNLICLTLIDSQLSVDIDLGQIAPRGVRALNVMPTDQHSPDATTAILVEITENLPKGE